MKRTRCTDERIIGIPPGEALTAIAMGPPRIDDLMPW